jgi:hypothetical protein
MAYQPSQIHTMTEAMTEAMTLTLGSTARARKLRRVSASGSEVVTTSTTPQEDHNS